MNMINTLFDRLFGVDGVHPFGHPDLLAQYLEDKYEKLEEEVFEVVKGDYKTSIVCKFNKEGYLVSHMASSSLITDNVMAQLKDQLMEAVEQEDYSKAMSIQEKINNKRFEEKPTL